MVEDSHATQGASLPEEGEADIGTGPLGALIAGFFGLVIVAAIGVWFLIQD